MQNTCWKCGTEFDGNVCPVCKTAAIRPRTAAQHTQQPQYAPPQYAQQPPQQPQYAQQQQQYAQQATQPPQYTQQQYNQPQQYTPQPMQYQQPQYPAQYAPPTQQAPNSERYTLRCPRCGSTHINHEQKNITNVNIKMKRGSGCLWWLLLGWIYLAYVAFVYMCKFMYFIAIGWWVSLIKSSKKRANERAVVHICQNCGNRWESK